jgi:hypothetical protein
MIVCCSYQCLRMCNFVSQPTLEAMKTLLIIGNVLSYNMNPGVSYVLLGIVVSLFLHSSNTNFFPRHDYSHEYSFRTSC